MPITTQIRGDFVDGAAVFADLERHPPTCPVRQRQACRSDAWFLLGPCSDQACCVGTRPPVFPPHEACGAAEGGEIHQLDQRTILDRRRQPTSLATGPQPTGLDMDPDRLIRVHVVDTEDVDIAESDKQFARGSRVGFHRGSPF